MSKQSTESSQIEPSSQDLSSPIISTTYLLTFITEETTNFGDKIVVVLGDYNFIERNRAIVKRGMKRAR